MNKKRLTIVASLVLAVALVVAGTTMAYLVSSGTKTNTFGIGTITTDITESSNPTPNFVNSIPIKNTIAPKLVQIENKAGEHAIDAYVRVQLVPTLKDDTGNLGGDFKMTIPTDKNEIVFTPFKNTVNPQDVTITLVFDSGWSNDWFYSSNDNCFYYSSIVKPGNRTTPLLQEVKFQGKDAAAWQTKFNLDVLTDSIQAGGNAVETEVNGTIAWPNVKIASGILQLN